MKKLILIAAFFFGGLTLVSAQNKKDVKQQTKKTEMTRQKVEMQTTDQNVNKNDLKQKKLSTDPASQTPIKNPRDPHKDIQQQQNPDRVRDQNQDWENQDPNMIEEIKRP